MSVGEGMDAGSLVAGASYLDRPAEEYVNDTNVETIWVMKAVEFSDVHYNIISSVDPKLLKLTKENDERIYQTFLEQFPNFDVENTTEESLKSDSAKENWRTFCEGFKDVEDYSYGTLLRLNCLKEYNEENTILVTRIQFLAIEIARNRMGCNDPIYQKNAIAKSELEKLKISKENS